MAGRLAARRAEQATHFFLAVIGADTQHVHPAMQLDETGPDRLYRVESVGSGPALLFVSGVVANFECKLIQLDGSTWPGIRARFLFMSKRD